MLNIEHFFPGILLLNNLPVHYWAHGNILNDGNYLYIDCSDGFMYIHLSKLLKLYTENMCILLYANYISITFIFKKQQGQGNSSEQWRLPLLD